MTDMYAKIQSSMYARFSNKIALSTFQGNDFDGACFAISSYWLVKRDAPCQVQTAFHKFRFWGNAAIATLGRSRRGFNTIWNSTSPEHHPVIVERVIFSIVNGQPPC